VQRKCKEERITKEDTWRMSRPATEPYRGIAWHIVVVEISLRLIQILDPHRKSYSLSQCHDVHLQNTPSEEEGERESVCIHAGVCVCVCVNAGV
jgi:hypothetical protein